ncbi:hypothetical protein VTK26DRAFT_2777 [Humicola hyalothermophila]
MKTPTPSLLLSALLATSTTVSAIGPASPHSPPRLKGAPAPVPGWKWKPNPFDSPLLARHGDDGSDDGGAADAKFTPTCSATAVFKARQYTLDDLSEAPPRGLLPYRDALKSVFSAREYPGSWDGIDPHGYDRTLLTMRYSDVPLRVREWIEEQERTGDDGDEGKKKKKEEKKEAEEEEEERSGEEKKEAEEDTKAKEQAPGKGLYAVYKVPLAGTRVLHTVKVPKETPVSDEWRARDEDRLVLFAPGALYEILPLWVAEGSKCEETLMDLSKYSSKLVDGGVIAYPVNYTQPKRSKGERDMEFTVKAEVLALKPGVTAEEAEQAAEKLEKVEKAEEAEAEAAAESEKGNEKDEL